MGNLKAFCLPRATQCRASVHKGSPVGGYRPCKDELLRSAMGQWLGHPAQQHVHEHLDPAQVRLHTSEPEHRGRLSWRPLSFQTTGTMSASVQVFGRRNAETIEAL